MSGDSRRVAGGKKAAQTNYARYGKEFYKRIGSMGGKLGTTGGFYANRLLARQMGSKGGLVTGDNYKTRRKNV